jgi:ABC-type dipeptide/oligopeptide/nickel transport system permease subunit
MAGNRMTAVCSVFLVLLAACGLFRSQVAPVDPLATDPVNRLQAPSASHPFGTDELGRDVLSRIIYGARPAVLVGLGAALLGTALGTAIGLLSAVVNSKLGAVVDALLDAALALPMVVVLLLVTAVAEPDIGVLVLVLGSLVTPGISKVVRSTALSLRKREYVSAAILIGATPLDIALRHVLPNLAAPVLALASISAGQVVVAEATLSFLGLGLAFNEPTWGAMLGASSRRFVESDPWLGVFPGLSIVLVVLSVNVLSDSARRALQARYAGI